MRKIKNLVLGGIQQKLFNLVLITLILVMGAYTLVILQQIGQLNQLVADTNERQKASISQISGQTMDAVIDQSMGEHTRMAAQLADDMFEDLAGATQMMGHYAQALFAHPNSYAAMPYAAPDPADAGTVTVQLLAEEGVDVHDPAIAKKLRLVANMSEMMCALYTTERINACYIALPEGVMLLSDDHPEGKFDESGQLLTIPITKRDWYTGAQAAGGLYFTDVSADVFTGQIGIMCSLPVYQNGELVCVVGADLYLDNMARAVSLSGDSGSFYLIVNERGHVVFSPKAQGTFQVRAGEAAQDLRLSEEASLARFVASALEDATDVQLVQADGENWYMAGAPVPTVGWTVISAVSEADANQPAVALEAQYDEILGEATAAYDHNQARARLYIILMMLVISGLAMAGALILSKRIVSPLNTMTQRVMSLSDDNPLFKMEDSYRTGDEIEVLAEAFAELSAKTVEYVRQVMRVTAEKERIGTELKMATSIQASQLPKLFPPFPNRSEFDIYASMTPAKEVGGDFYDFFMVDDDHIALVMADVSGKGVPAALFMMVSRMLIKTHLQNGETPGEALANVNNQLCESNEQELFVTVWAAVVEISTGRGIAANAGHEHPALRRANGEYQLVVYRHSPAVAVMEGIPFAEHTFELHPGDSLFVYTDGVAEATNGQMELFGPERMLEALNANPGQPPREALASVMEGIDRFMGGAEQFDDITMLCFEYK